ncbi:putative charged multivesicular body protein 3 [Paratrimastix pyriformis]|uniref:Charged multivesicular body protein 3 n=1 Tax=Paratrimastix pyriformis TaxID=342808 RepID=A0ABQ8UUL9_9EUKA|nr:putative charged multivesicular body protein 3 [Paratrimastix pyriformis]
MGIFGNAASGSKPTDVQDAARQWKLNLKGEERKLDRQIHAIELEEMKAKKAVKDCAKRHDLDSARILARELVNSRKAKERFLITKTQINSTIMAISHQMASMRVAGAISKSTEVMQAMNRLMRLPELGETARQLSQEMMKAGLIEETISDAMESVAPVNEAEADAEVDRALAEVIGGIVDQAAPVRTPLPAQAQAAAEAPAESEESQVRARLQALRS